MKISELIKVLEEMKTEYGDTIVLGCDGYETDFVESQKYFRAGNVINDIIDIHTEDLDDNYLEEWYSRDEEHKNLVVEKGICVKIY